MAVFLGIAGLSGAGKTTAVEHLASSGHAQALYAGDAVIKEVQAQGLVVNPENERAVRIGLRKALGPAALAELLVPQVRDLIALGSNVLIDAIFSLEELETYKAVCGGHTVIVLAIEASFEIRATRLSHRPIRPSTRSELESRDATELNKLGTDMVLNQATFKIRNEASISEFLSHVEAIWLTL